MHSPIYSPKTQAFIRLLRYSLLLFVLQATTLAGSNLPAITSSYLEEQIHSYVQAEGQRLSSQEATELMEMVFEEYHAHGIAKQLLALYNAREQSFDRHKLFLAALKRTKPKTIQLLLEGGIYDSQYMKESPQQLLRPMQRWRRLAHLLFEGFFLTPLFPPTPANPTWSEKALGYGRKAIYCAGLIGFVAGFLLSEDNKFLIMLNFLNFTSLVRYLCGDRYGLSSFLLNVAYPFTRLGKYVYIQWRLGIAPTYLHLVLYNTKRSRREVEQIATLLLDHGADPNAVHRYLTKQKMPHEFMEAGSIVLFDYHEVPVITLAVARNMARLTKRLVDQGAKTDVKRKSYSDELTPPPGGANPIRFVQIYYSTAEPATSSSLLDLTTEGSKMWRYLENLGIRSSSALDGEEGKEASCSS
jgi:hypothetical protein